MLECHMYSIHIQSLTDIFIVLQVVMFPFSRNDGTLRCWCGALILQAITPF